MGGKAWCCGGGSGGGGLPSVEGVTGGDPAPVGAGRSVDVDVAPDGTGGLQVGARLSPAFGEVLLPAAVDMVAAGNDVWINTGLSVTLPEAGVYEVTATVRTSIAVGAAGVPFAVNVSGRLANASTGAAIPGTDYTLQQINEIAPSGQTTWVALSTFHKFVMVSEPTSIRLEAARNTINGTAVAVTGVQTGNTRLAYVKISD